MYIGYTSITFSFIYFNFYRRICLLIFFQRERKREREKRERETSIWERDINQVPPICAQNGDWTCNLGMCLHWELNPYGWHSNKLSNLARAITFIFKNMLTDYNRPAEGLKYVICKMQAYVHFLWDPYLLAILLNCSNLPLLELFSSGTVT